MAKAYQNGEARAQYKQRLAIGIGLLKGIDVVCEHCDKLVPSDIPWQCPRCSTVNGATKRSSFLRHCPKCKFVPMSYACPHCRKVNPLEGEAHDDKPVKLYAPIAAPKTATVTHKPSPPVTVESKRKSEIEELAHKISVARLNRELTQIQSSNTPAKELTIIERLEKELDESEQGALGARILAKKKREEYAVRFKDDPTLLHQMNMVIDEWLEKHT